MCVTESHPNLICGGVDSRQRRAKRVDRAAIEHPVARARQKTDRRQREDSAAGQWAANRPSPARPSHQLRQDRIVVHKQRKGLEK